MAYKSVSAKSKVGKAVIAACKEDDRWVKFDDGRVIKFSCKVKKTKKR